MDPQNASILIPTDGSEGATVGARHAVHLAATLGADVHVLSVVDTRALESNRPVEDPEATTDRVEVRDAAANRWVDEATGLARGGVSGPIRTTVERGIPHRTITEYARTNDIDLIVMGTTGRTGLEQTLLGSVTERTLRITETPVLAVPTDADPEPDSTPTYDDVLLPTDGSGGAERALEVAVALADAVDATVHALYSVDTSILPITAPDDLYEELDEVGREALERVRDYATADGVRVTGELGRGPASDMIRSYSEEHDVDLIVMGTHGRSGVRRYLLGSVTEAVVREAAVPVCCVPMDEADEA